LGKDGDFITASEISQTFCELNTAYFIELTSAENNSLKNANYQLVEMGAGRGTFFIDMLRTVDSLASKNLTKATEFIEKVEFNIIEVNQELTKLQQKKIKEFFSSAKIINKKVQHFQDFISFIAKVKQEKSSLLFFANELFDCLPIRQFSYFNNQWQERGVIKQENQLKFAFKAVDNETKAIIEKKIDAPTIEKMQFLGKEAIFEYCQEAEILMAQICKSLSENDGFAIIIDYGYLHNPLIDNLQSLRKHQFSSPLSNIGTADITSLVDFSGLISIAKEQNIVYSLVTQRDFLISLGIEKRREILLKNCPLSQRLEINSSIDRLIDKNQMGELFKCLILWKR
jgi:SAM-dependent MidA family methyltransferase